MNEKLPFAFNETHDSTGFLLWQVTSVWQRRIAEALKDHGLTQVQFVLLAGILWLSKQEKWITQVMLARHTKLDVMMTSQVLRNLESKGFLERSLHPTDTRAKILKLTSLGLKSTKKAIPAVEKVDMEFFGTLGAKQKDFNASLSKLIPDAE
jgi:DNA-binding MarR family transcriptional regulator